MYQYSPHLFNYQDYYFIVSFTYKERKISICRKGNSFIFKNENNLMLFDSISEMKRYWNKHIFSFPMIVKNGREKIVDPELFVQLFFVAQDKKDTSNIANSGQYNKTDFINMIYSIFGVGEEGLKSDDIAAAKQQILDLKDQKKALLSEYRFLKSPQTSATFLSQNSDRLLFSSKIEKADKIKEIVSSLRKERNSAFNRKIKYEITIKELNSLNISIDTGELRCLECNSTHIGFAPRSDKNYSFDISTLEIRNQIIKSIEDKIEAYQEEIERCTAEININQEQLQQLLVNREVSLETLLSHKKDIIDIKDVETRIAQIIQQEQRLDDILVVNEHNTTNKTSQRQDVMAKIINEMNIAYRQIDPAGNLEFTDLYTKRDQVFSGSEATEFHIIKLLALAKIMGHKYPIIIDSFRAEDLSTEREDVVLQLFSELDNQVILTTTLKTEELGKYNERKRINHIDYSTNIPSKLLSAKNVSGFIDLLQSFSLEISSDN